MGSTRDLLRLTLHKGEDNDHKVFRLKKGVILHFVLGPELANDNVRLFTNHPAHGSAPDRHKYHELKWQNYCEHKSDVYDNYAECFIRMAGSYNYYFTLDDTDAMDNADGHGYYLVDPVLKVGSNDAVMPLDAITAQTYLPKQLGIFPEWRDRLRVAKESGYNMIHFTPLQELGKSTSAYCLADQLGLNPNFSKDCAKQYTMDDVASFIDEMKNDWEILSLTDLVLNHTANESVWVTEHPECTYNTYSSPHLKPAFLLDRILWHFTIEVGNGKWTDRGVPPSIKTEDHLSAIKYILEHEILPTYNIHDYFLLHIDHILEQFKSARSRNACDDACGGSDLVIIPDPQWRRLKATINIPLALHKYPTRSPRMEGSETELLDQCCSNLRSHLEYLNHTMRNTIDSHLQAAVNNFLDNIRWRFLNPAGPKVSAVSEEDPLMWNYFTLTTDNLTVDQEEELMHTQEWGSMQMAHNGWVMGDDPLKNFAEPGSNVYLRRELLPWGDSVKLRYGKKPEDCPFLWEHMRQYAVSTAKIFHGVRLDNCHSTPIHVAEYLLDEARKVRPDLYIIAELFTSSEHLDNAFINRLGLTSLIREALAAGDPHDLGRLVHRYGGQPVGSFMQPPERPLTQSIAHAMFMDQTHDNESPIERHSAYDLLPSSALVAMTMCATGSNRGYDEMVPHHIHVVTETRLYKSFTDNAELKVGEINVQTGIIAAKKALNELHQQLGEKHFSQVFVDQVTANVVSVTRHNPEKHQSVIMFAHTAFSHPHSMHSGHIPTFTIPGRLDEIILEGRCVQVNGVVEFSKDDAFLNGLPNYKLELLQHISLSESKTVAASGDSTADKVKLDFINFPPGSIIAFQVSLEKDASKAISVIRQCMSQFGYRMRSLSGRNLNELCGGNELETIVANLSLEDISRVMYRVDAEERDDGHGGGGYDVPGHGVLPYCGLEGVVTILNRIRPRNDLGDGLCENLRNGDWMADYIVRRLQQFPSTEELGNWFQGIFTSLKKCPAYLKPAYFDAIVTGVYWAVEEVTWAKMPDFIREGSTFVRSLGKATLQFCSILPGAELPPLSPSIAPANEDQLTICAGLPHFSSGIFRNWGRDTFIALRGCLLLTGRYEEARRVILGYAGSLRHGLIPNLLGGGVCARYNCRDAVWWWLQCIQDYAKCVPDGTNILKDPVSRMYPTDDAIAGKTPPEEQPLQDVIQEALQRHSDGISFRERNAGHDIDRDMSSAGFDVHAAVNWDNGFVYGGNKSNCGTWMDKMGSSEATGNAGKPATPRDGSAVELVGLCKSTVRWLAEMYQQGLYPYDGVMAKTSNGDVIKMKFSGWNVLIAQKFEEYFYISPSPAGEAKQPLINRRGIYKDSHGSSVPYTDFQLRCNFPITMVVAPELFTPRNAWIALSRARDILLGPLGIKTLDPSDWNYNGNYVNSDMSKGFNYHQGPEWVWPVGFVLRAMLHFSRLLPGNMATTTVDFIKTYLSAHNLHINTSSWKSLPELTNKDGMTCFDSCPAQAWSIGCILEVMYDLEKLSWPN